MDNQIHNTIVSFIWGIADDCLRDVYVRGKYRDVILPMTVIRRLDAMLEDSKEAVLDMKSWMQPESIISGQRCAMRQGRHSVTPPRSVCVISPAAQRSKR